MKWEEAKKFTWQGKDDQESEAESEPETPIPGQITVTQLFADIDEVKEIKI